MLVANKRIQIKAIQIGEKNQEVVEVLGGIKAGETIVRDGSQEFKEGTRVKPLAD